MYQIWNKRTKYSSFSSIFFILICVIGYKIRRNDINLLPLTSKRNEIHTTNLSLPGTHNKQESINSSVFPPSLSTVKFISSLPLTFFSTLSVPLIQPTYAPTSYPVENTQCHIPPLESVEQFFTFLRRDLVYCPHIQQRGGALSWGKRLPFIDGQKNVCEEELYDERKREPCVVLSFGINDEWSFDDAMAMHGCKVYSFDPTMNEKSHQRSHNLQFFNVGLSSFTGYKNILGKEVKVDTFSNILHWLHLENTTISYLKVDIDDSEIEFLEDVLLGNAGVLKKVRQIGMEIHPGKHSKQSTEIDPKSPMRALWPSLHLLECQGFHPSTIQLNPSPYNKYVWRGTVQSCCYEILWIKKKQPLYPNPLANV